MRKWKLHSDVFFRHRGGYSLKELWFNLVLLKFEHRCGLSKSTGSAGPGENNSEDEYPNLNDSDIHLHNTCETDLNDEGTFRDISEDSYNTDCVIENKICKGHGGCPIWNNKKRGYSIRSCDERDFSSSVCGESENSSQIEHFGIITSTNDSDFTEIESDTEEDFTQIESTTEEGSTQIESTTEEDSTQIESTTEEDSTPSYKHLWVLCEECYTLNYKRFLKERLYICEECESHLKMNSSERIELLIDPNTWDPMNEKIASMDPIKWDSEEALSGSDSEEAPIGSEEALSGLYSEETSGKSINLYSASATSYAEADPSQSDPPEETLIEFDDPLDSERALTGLYSKETSGIDMDLYRTSATSYAEADPSRSDPPEETLIEFNDLLYIDRIDSYQKKTGLTEAIQTGIGQLNGIPVAMGVMEFEFMGGSMGSVVGEKITRLIEYATNQSLPLIIVCASGGARMQEGSLSLMQMAKISSALYHFQTNQKLFYVSILTSPTTGGVTASFGMLGDIIIAEPNAYIAFAGKRVIEQTLNIEVPEGSQETEYLFDKGLFDLVVPRNTLKSVLNELFQVHGFFPLNQNSIE
nr:acetyl-CoA carboxylase beta subunit [Triplostegia sp. 20213]WCR48896.1 acetyl-CoA carboxylase beta subunit [Triplostegia sp. 20552]WCR49061.1 acetyl-CoA carboxylase beta subunit [Triplostegia sp. 20922]WCR49227.1 acetyl-CoA carboxylase beta subunit [Triplostegia sp. 201190]WCR49310.1 acetyl-CoA carboxylase beta subunit [Triplostegia sp. 201430]WCR49393.1 acetyl-CoA carboxylase beta subunit [Triplostegia sp. 201546]WCR49476.1 acetyl-CoA carboxylase beta subunit [Triplostegia sp. 201623]WCR